MTCPNDLYVMWIGATSQAILQAAITRSAQFGTEPCLTSGVIGHAISSNPNTHLFWDGLHPTTAGHQFVAAAALRLLSQ